MNKFESGPTDDFAKAQDERKRARLNLAEKSENVNKKTSESERGMNRRDFLKYTAAAAAAAVAPGILGKAAEWYQRQNKLEEAKNITGNNEQIAKSEKEAKNEPNRQRPAGTEALSRSEKAEEADKKARNETKEQTMAREVCDKVLDAYYQVSSSRVWPNELFTDDLFVAQQLAESKFDSQAESSAGAAGVMQTRPVAKKDVIRYLNKLSRNDVIDFDVQDNVFDQFDGANGKKIMGSVMQLVKENSDYSRAFGKIYMSLLQDSEFGYGVGSKAVSRGKNKKALKQVLAAYNAGRRRTDGIPEISWPKETKNYCKNIFDYKNLFNQVRSELKLQGLKADDNEAVMLITRGLAELASSNKWRRRSLGRIIERMKEFQSRRGQNPSKDELKRLIAMK